MNDALKDIDLLPEQREEVKRLLKKYLPNTEVWAYGSRVKFSAKPSSDLDLVVFSSTDQELKVADLKEAFEESYLPFRIDLFVWKDLPESFQKNAKKQHIVLQENSESPPVVRKED
jgi:type I restriction enzyme S subunit